MRYGRLTALALLVTSLPFVSHAQSLRLTNTTLLEYRGDNQNGIETDDDYGVGLNKLYLDGHLDETSAHLQLDGVFFSREPDLALLGPARPSAYTSEVRLERFRLQHDVGQFSLIAGDSYLQLGRGIALSLRKVDELGLDQTLQGGNVRWDGAFATLQAFAGRVNIANLDGVTQKHLEDPYDLLGGARSTFHLGLADFSVHALYLRPRIPFAPSMGDDYTTLGGAYLDLPLSYRLSLYVEGAVQRYRLAGEEQEGTAAYASADLDLEIVSLLLEGLWLDDFQVAGSFDETLQRRNIYSQPPTLERFDQEVLDNKDVRGGRARLSRPFLDGSLVFHLNGMYRQYGPEASAVDAFHGYGGFEFTYGSSSRWFASAGYREEVQDGHVIKTMVHGESDWVQELGGGYSFQLTVGHESRTLDARPYVRGTTLFGVDKSELGSLLLEVGYDTFDPTQRTLFLAGIVAWRSMDWLQVRAIVGSQRGGIKCIGGVCRDFPAFSGGRLEAVLYYDLL